MFFLERADKTGWEEVDQFVFTWRDKATLPDGQPRYSGNWVSKVPGSGICIQYANAEEKDIALICRFLNITYNVSGISFPGGFVKTPEFIRIQLTKNRTVLHEMNGSNYKLVDKPSEEEAA